jgi:hypothetical protein
MDLLGKIHCFIVFLHGDKVWLYALLAEMVATPRCSFLACASTISSLGVSKIFKLVKLFELDSLKAWLMLGSKPKQAELKPQKQLASFFAQVRAV